PDGRRLSDRVSEASHRARNDDHLGRNAALETEPQRQIDRIIRYSGSIDERRWSESRLGDPPGVLLLGHANLLQRRLTEILPGIRVTPVGSYRNVGPRRDT